MDEVGGHLWRSSSPVFCSGHGQLETLLRAVIGESLSISKDGDSTGSLGNLSQCLITLMVKGFFLIFQWKMGDC